MLPPDEQAVVQATEVAGVSPEKWVSVAVGIMALVGGLYAAGVRLLRPLTQLRADHEALDARVAKMKGEQEKRLDRVENAVGQIHENLAAIPKIKEDVADMKLTTAVMASEAKAATQTAARTETIMNRIEEHLTEMAADVNNLKGAAGRMRAPTDGQAP